MFFPSPSQTTSIPLKRTRSGQPRRTWTSAAWSSTPRHCSRQGFWSPSLRRGKGGGRGRRRRSKSESFFDPFVDYSSSPIRIVLQQAKCTKLYIVTCCQPEKMALHVNRHAICQIELMERCLWVKIPFHLGALIVGQACHLSKFNHKGFFAIVFVQKRIQSRPMAWWWCRFQGVLFSRRAFSHRLTNIGTKGWW